MLRQTPCETSNSGKGRDLIWVLFPRGRPLPQRQEGLTGLRRSDLTRVYWIHAWSRAPSESGADISPLGFTSQTREGKTLSRRAGLRYWFVVRIYEFCSRDSIPTQSGKYGAILGARGSWMKEFYVTELKRRKFLKKKKAISEMMKLSSKVESVTFDHWKLQQHK